MSGGTGSKGVGMCGQLMYIFICKQLRVLSGQGNGLSVRSTCPCGFVLSCSACSGHRKIYQRHLVKLDVDRGRLLRTMFGPPPEMDWNLPWREILHA